MKQKKSNRKLSRKFRKLVKAGRLKLSRKINPDENISTLRKNTLNKVVSVAQKTENSTNASNKQIVISPIKKVGTETDKKRKEIISHLRTVMLTSLFCLIVLGALYYLDQSNDWVNKLNLEAKKFLTGWSWQI